MRLRADHDGITTWDDPPVRPSRGRLDPDHARVDVAGLTFAETATAVGLTAPPLDQVYRDGPHVSTNERVMLDPTEVPLSRTHSISGTPPCGT